MQRYASFLNIAILIVNLLMMISVGLSLEREHFRALAHRKGAILGLLTAQTVLLPLIGLLVVTLLSLPENVNAGILLLAACPVGDIANFYSLLAKADTALSVSLNTASCMLSVVTMPAVFAVYEFFQGDAFVFAVPPATLVAKLTLLVVMPLTAGMLLRWFSPILSARLAEPVRVGSLIGIVGLLIAVLTLQYDRLASDWRPTLAGAFLLMSGAMFAGLALAAILRLPRRQLVTVAITFPVRNIGLAVAIAVTFLGRVEYAAFAFVFFLVEVPLLLGLVGGYSRWFHDRGAATNRVISSDAPES